MKRPNFKFLLLVLSSLIFQNSIAQDSTMNSEAKDQFKLQEVQRPINAADIVVPEGYKIEALESGFTYPVDVTFDENGNAYVAEAGGHTYGTKPPEAPDARIIKILANGTMEILYDKVVPMQEIQAEASSNDMSEGLIPPVTGVTYHDNKLYISHRSRYSVYDLQTNEFKTIINGLPSWGEFLNA